MIDTSTRLLIKSFTIEELDREAAAACFFKLGHEHQQHRRTSGRIHSLDLCDFRQQARTV
jgi:hypothetical protein